MPEGYVMSFFVKMQVTVQEGRETSLILWILACCKAIYTFLSITHFCNLISQAFNRPGRKLGRLGHLGLLEPNCPSFLGPSFPVSLMFKLENLDLSDEIVRLFLCPNYRSSYMRQKKTRTCWNSKTRTSRTKRPKFPLCPNYRISEKRNSVSLFYFPIDLLLITFYDINKTLKISKGQ